jgi:hypothetical protein
MAAFFLVEAAETRSRSRMGRYGPLLWTVYK